MMKRRQFLRGAGGVVFGLPFLEGLLTGEARAAGKEPEPFACFMRQGNGNVDSKWFPKNPGAIIDDSLNGTALEALKGYKNKLLTVDGIALNLQDGESNQRCGHAYAGAQIFTGADVHWQGDRKNDTTSKGPSIDWEIARYFKGEPLNLIAARYTNHIYAVLSYKGDNERGPRQPNPYEAYKKMFGVQQDTRPKGNVDLMRKSVNDLVKGQMDALLKSTKISSTDKLRLQAHLENVRETEKNIGSLDLSLAQDKIKNIETTKGWNQEDGKYADVPAIAKMHLDIMALAVTTGQTRAAVLQFGQGMDTTNYSAIGVGNYHENSHWVNGQSDKHFAVDKLVVEHFKYLLDRLSSYDMGGGKTALDFGTCVLFNDLRGGLAHAVKNLPFAMAGGMNGKLVQGVHLKIGETRVNRFWNTIAHAMGVKASDGSEFSLNGTESVRRGLVKEMLKGG